MVGWMVGWLDGWMVGYLEFWVMLGGWMVVLVGGKTCQRNHRLERDDLIYPPVLQ